MAASQKIEISLAAHRGGFRRGVLLCPVAYSYFAYWLAAPQQESSSCTLDLGRNWQSGKGEAIPNCQPVGLKLALAAAKVKSSDRYGLWYRVTLKNDTSFDLSEVLADDRVPYFTVWDSSGVEVSNARAGFFRDISPYEIDPEAWNAIRTDAGLKLFKPESHWTDVPTLWTMTLPYGRSVDSLPWILPPGSHGRNLVAPPRGYAGVDAYVFKKMGRYRIQARLFNEFHQVLVYPRVEWCRRHLPRFAEAVIDRLKVVPYGKSLHLLDNGDMNYEMRALSNTVEFDVVP